MTCLRAHLHRLTIVWLLSQVLSMSVVLPFDGRMDAAAATSADCQGGTNGICPMHASTGEECPMQSADASSGSRQCVIRGLADGPDAGLGALLWVSGVLATPVRFQPSLVRSDVQFESSRHLDAVLSHDSPPPRA
jgi:hypothetical protein